METASSQVVLVQAGTSTSMFCRWIFKISITVVYHPKSLCDILVVIWLPVHLVIPLEDLMLNHLEFHTLIMTTIIHKPFQENTVQSPSQTRKGKETSTETSKDGLAYSCLLKNELLSAGIDDLKVSFWFSQLHNTFTFLVYQMCLWCHILMIEKPFSCLLKQVFVYILLLSTCSNC